MLHMNYNHLVCRVCNETLLSIKELHKHIQQVHDGRRYHCKYCLKLYKTRSSRDGHEDAKHTGKYSHYCSICNTGYVSGANLRAHESAVHEKVTFEDISFIV